MSRIRTHNNRRRAQEEKAQWPKVEWFGDFFVATYRDGSTAINRRYDFNESWNDGLHIEIHNSGQMADGTTYSVAGPWGRPV